MAIFSIGNNIYSTVYTSGHATKNQPQESDATASGAGQTLKTIADMAGDAAPVLSAAGKLAGKLLHVTA